uniref:DUF2321 domain-containing protein n=1 Tax=Sulfobacillus thermotolerans TaxID=338644 RepID=UPI003D75C273
MAIDKLAISYCRQGHLCTPSDRFCTKCGEIVYHACPNCGHSYPDVIVVGKKPDSFCSNCGEKQPWGD